MARWLNTLPRHTGMLHPSVLLPMLPSLAVHCPSYPQGFMLHNALFRVRLEGMLLGLIPQRLSARQGQGAHWDCPVAYQEQQTDPMFPVLSTAQEGAHGDMDGDPDGEAASAEGEEDEEEGDDGLGPLPAGLRPEPPELREQEGKVLGLRLLFKVGRGGVVCGMDAWC